jgi:hypothetical protein
MVAPGIHISRGGVGQPVGGTVIEKTSEIQTSVSTFEGKSGYIYP